MTVRQLLREGARRGAARHEAEWLLGRLLDLRVPELYLQEARIDAETQATFLAQLTARAGGAPLQYLLGETEFYGHTMAVAPGVFIPRPETESVVAAALEELRRIAERARRPLRVLDLGTGSGCIAVAVAKTLPACVVVAVELSWHALCVASANVQRHGLAKRVQVVQGCWAEPLRGTFDGILSNPPYVPRPQVDGLPREVRHEPRLSLDGGPDGLDALRTVAHQAPARLAPGGVLAVECGEAQVAPLHREVARAGWAARVAPLRDLAGRGRGLLAVASGEGHG